MRLGSTMLFLSRKEIPTSDNKTEPIISMGFLSSNLKHSYSNNKFAYYFVSWRLNNPKSYLTVNGHMNKLNILQSVKYLFSEEELIP